MTEEVARALIEAQGFVVGDVSYTLTEDIPESTVISQSPGGGTPADAGTEVDLIVSRGPFSVEVPETSGMSVDAAQLELARAGFEDVTTDEEFSPDIAAGDVTRTDPEAGRVVSRETPIILYVSAGEETVVVPELRGITLADARVVAENAKLVLIDGGIVQVSASGGLVGLVAEQVPGEGQAVAVGTEVTVKVGVILQVPVPNFSEMTIEQAQVAASSVGLSVIAAGTTDTDNEALEGKVATQNPAAGTPVDEGSTVQVTLYVFVPPPTTTTEPPTTTPPEPPPEPVP